MPPTTKCPLCKQPVNFLERRLSLPSRKSSVVSQTRVVDAQLSRLKSSALQLREQLRTAQEWMQKELKEASSSIIIMIASASALPTKEFVTECSAGGAVTSSPPSPVQQQQEQPSFQPEEELPQRQVYVPSVAGERCGLVLQCRRCTPLRNATMKCEAQRWELENSRTATTAASIKGNNSRRTTTTSSDDNVGELTRRIQSLVAAKDALRRLHSELQKAMGNRSEDNINSGGTSSSSLCEEVRECLVEILRVRNALCDDVLDGIQSVLRDLNSRVIDGVISMAVQHPGSSVINTSAFSCTVDAQKKLSAHLKREVPQMFRRRITTTAIEKNSSSTSTIASLLSSREGVGSVTGEGNNVIDDDGGVVMSGGDDGKASTCSAINCTEVLNSGKRTRALLQYNDATSLMSPSFQFDEKVDWVLKKATEDVSLITVTLQHANELRATLLLPSDAGLSTSTPSMAAEEGSLQRSPHQGVRVALQEGEAVANSSFRHDITLSSLSGLLLASSSKTQQSPPRSRGDTSSDSDNFRTIHHDQQQHSQNNRYDSLRGGKKNKTASVGSRHGVFEKLKFSMDKHREANSSVADPLRIDAHPELPKAHGEVLQAVDEHHHDLVEAIPPKRIHPNQYHHNASSSSNRAHHQARCRSIHVQVDTVGSQEHHCEDVLRSFYADTATLIKLPTTLAGTAMNNNNSQNTTTSSGTGSPPNTSTQRASLLTMQQQGERNEIGSSTMNLDDDVVGTISVRRPQQMRRLFTELFVVIRNKLTNAQGSTNTGISNGSRGLPLLTNQTEAQQQERQHLSHRQIIQLSVPRPSAGAQRLRPPSQKTMMRGKSQTSPSEQTRRPHQSDRNECGTTTSVLSSPTSLATNANSTGGNNAPGTRVEAPSSPFALHASRLKADSLEHIGAPFRCLSR